MQRIIKNNKTKYISRDGKRIKLLPYMSKLTIIVIKVRRNVIMGVGVGNIRKLCSCTRPPVITADLAPGNHPRFLQITDRIFSTAMYKAQAFAAQYECTKPLLNGNKREII